MKAKRFSEEQIIGVLKEAEAGAKTKDLCRQQAARDLGGDVLQLEGADASVRFIDSHAASTLRACVGPSPGVAGTSWKP